MPRFVALLRGVNVGKAKRVPMADLRLLMEQLGYEDVRTLLNSGNAVFGSRQRAVGRHAQAIHDAIQADIGVDVPVVVVAAGDVARIIDDNPFTGPFDPARLLVAFPFSPDALNGLSALGAMRDGTDRLHVGTLAAYLHCPDGILESPIAKAMLGKRGGGVTTRNWATTLKLRDMLTG